MHVRQCASREREREEKKMRKQLSPLVTWGERGSKKAKRQRDTCTHEAERSESENVSGFK